MARTKCNGVDNNRSGFITWSDNPGLVMSHFDATNLPEGLLAQQYTMCDNFFHSAFGGSFLNHQFLIAAAAPVYDNMPSSNNGNIAYLDSDGLFVLNTSGTNAGKQVQDGSITPIAGDQLTVTINGAAKTSRHVRQRRSLRRPAARRSTSTTWSTPRRSRNLAVTETDAFPTYRARVPSQNDSNPSDSTRPYIPTIGDLLSANNVSWKWYSGGLDPDPGAYSGIQSQPDRPAPKLRHGQRHAAVPVSPPAARLFR